MPNASERQASSQDGRLLMARTVKSAARKQERVAAEVTARMLLEVTDDTPVYYVNYAEVTHSAHDFAAAWADTG